MIAVSPNVGNTSMSEKGSSEKGMGALPDSAVPITPATPKSPMS